MSLPNQTTVPPNAAPWAPPAAASTPAASTVAATSAEPTAARTTGEPGVDAGVLLFDTREQAETAVDKAASRVQPSDGKKKLTAVARKVAHREVQRAIVGLLDIKLGTIVLRAWQRHGALMSAANRTVNGGRELVLLADPTVSSTHRPHVELVIDGAEIGRVAALIELSLQLTGINAIVERGSVIGLDGGSVAASAKFSIEDVPIASRSRTMDARAVIHLGTPLRLAGPAGQPAHSSA